MPLTIATKFYELTNDRNQKKMYIVYKKKGERGKERKQENQRRPMCLCVSMGRSGRRAKLAKHTKKKKKLATRKNLIQMTGTMKIISYIEDVQQASKSSQASEQATENAKKSLLRALKQISTQWNFLYFLSLSWAFFAPLPQFIYENQKNNTKLYSG